MLLDASFLHLEQIREVGAQLDLDGAVRRLLAEVADLDVFAHAAPDVAPARDEEVRVGASGGRRPAQHEHAAERIRRHRGEGLELVAVQPEAELRQEPRIAKDQALRSIRVDLAAARRQTERRALDEGHDAIGTAERRARARRPRLGHEEERYLLSSPAPPGPLTGTLTRDAYRDRCARMVSDPSGRIRRDRARRRAARRRSRRRRARRDAVRGTRFDDQGRAGHDLRRATRTARARQPLVRLATTRSAAYLRVDGFDIVHDHAGIIGPVCAAMLGGHPPVVHTLHGPWTEEAKLLYSLVNGRVHLVAVSDAQAAENPDVTYAAIVHNGIDVDAYTVPGPQGRLPRLHRRANPDKGPVDAIRIARQAGPPVEDDPEAGRAAGDRVLRARGRTAARPRRRAVRERDARGEGRAARPGPGHAVPDPLAGAVRPRHGRGDGVRHARRHDELGRGAASSSPTGSPASAATTPTTSRTPSASSTSSIPPRAGPGSRSASRPPRWCAPTRASTPRSPRKKSGGDFHYVRSVIKMAAVTAIPPAPRPALEIDDLHVSVDDREILEGVSLAVGPGELHALMGPNGSGKSTLANTLLGNPVYEITGGRILLAGEDITPLPTDERAARGLFLGFQHPEEVPGVSVLQLPAPGDGPPQGHRRLLDPRSAHADHGVEQAARHGRPVPGPVPERGLLRRREEAQRDPPDGAARARRRGARRDRLRARHRRACATSRPVSRRCGPTARSSGSSS